MKSFKKMSRFLIAFSLIMITTLTHAEKFPDAVDDYVNDFANVINADDAEEIRKKLYDLRMDNDIEMMVVTIDSIKPYQSKEVSFGDPLTNFSESLFNQWDIGFKTDDGKGVLLLIVADNQKVRILMGSSFNNRYDEAMKKIIDEQLMPKFRTGDFSIVAVNGVQEIIGTVVPLSDVIFGMNWLAISLAGLFLILLFPILFKLLNGFLNEQRSELPERVDEYGEDYEIWLRRNENSSEFDNGDGFWSNRKINSWRRSNRNHRNHKSLLGSFFDRDDD